MRLASCVFRTRKSIPCIWSHRTNIFKRKTDLFTGHPAEIKMNNSAEGLSSHSAAANLLNTPDSNIIWIDMEMTGLDPEKDAILEIACLITDKHINIISEGLNLVIHQPLEKLNSMNKWCLKHHTKNELFKNSLESNVSLEKAEDEVLKFVQRYTPQGKCPLAGNSVYMDKWFLLKYMPRLCEHLHYRILDVSTIKILAKNWCNLDPPKKMLTHRAMEDIKESIKELTYYQNAIFKSAQSELHKTSAS